MIHRVQIEKIIARGFGLGRLEDGQVVLTRFVLPGETVLAREISRHRSYLEALPVEIIEPSGERVSPPCPYFTICGGCDFQHIDGAAQPRIKSAVIREAMQRAGVTADENIYQRIIPSPQSYHYRYRIRLQVSADRRIGFYQTGSNELVEIDRCLLASETINRALHELKQSELLEKISGLKEIEFVQSPSGNTVFAVLHLQQSGKIRTPSSSLAASFQTIDSVLVKKGKNILSAGGDDPDHVLFQDFDDRLCGSPFRLTWGPGCFFQVNAAQNEQLIKLVCSQFGKCSGRRSLELYCGMGNFSIPLGLSGAEITGVEQNRESIRWAELNAGAAGLDRFRFLTTDVGRYLTALAGKQQSFDTLILDPPRQGLGRLTEIVAILGPADILYVSCDPATLARDLGILTGAGYRLQSLTPVDMFPQTHHIESVAHLEKN